MPADEFGECSLFSTEKSAQQFIVAHRRFCLGERAENGLEGTQGHGRLVVVS